MQSLSTTNNRITEVELATILGLSKIEELTWEQRYIIRSIVPHLSFGEDGQLKIVGKKKHGGNLRISLFVQMLMGHSSAKIGTIIG